MVGDGFGCVVRMAFELIFLNDYNNSAFINRAYSRNFHSIFQKQIFKKKLTLNCIVSRSPANSSATEEARK